MMDASSASFDSTMRYTLPAAIPGAAAMSRIVVAS
jgi:hypothetical protein